MKLSQCFFSFKSSYLFGLFLIAFISGCQPDNEPGNTNTTFDEKYRPQFHYTPATNWMNDPNGLVYFDGKYHLFHQYNPFGNTWGHMSWGHAVSTDLVHWEHRPVAIPEEGNEMIFSGSAVIDYKNTSGFGDGSVPPMVAIYTSHYTLGEDSVAQAQSLAYSLDGGATFTKYEGNPVLEFDDPDFRDPNVKWNEEMNRWLMAVALPKQHKVRFYASDNLKEWEFLSDFGPAGAVGGIWECPDFFRLPVDGDPDNMKWVLHVDMNPGSIAGGSGSQYFIGDWDGKEFIPDETVHASGEPLWVDYGTDFYAAISWNNIPEEDGRRIWVGWMNNWDYANSIPTDPWRSAQSIPRSLHLVSSESSIQLVQKPVEELQKLRGEKKELQSLAAESSATSLAEEGISGAAFEMIVEIDPGTAQRAGFQLRKGDGEQTVIGYDRETESVYADRTESGETGFHEGFASVSRAPVSTEDGRLRFHIFVDWSSAEVFVNGGKTVFTNRIFPGSESTDIAFFAEGGRAELTDLVFWKVNSIWNK